VTRDEAKAVLDRVMAEAGSREAEAILGGGVSALTRFANNEITQNVLERRYLLSVRIQEGKRTGRASGNDLSDSGIARLVRDAAEAAAIQPEISDLPPLPEAQTYRPVEAYDGATAGFSPEARQAEVARAVEACRRAGLLGAGIYETGEGTIGEYGEIDALAISNSRGVFAYHRGTSANFRVSALSGTAGGWASRESDRAADIDGGALADRAVEKALRSREPRAWDPGVYTVVLEPAAVADLIQEMAWVSFGALLVQEGRSFLAGNLGRRLMGENITIRDDPFHPLHRSAPFDSEGMPTRPVTIIEGGFARSPVYDRRTAAKEGKESTGHALPMPNTIGPVARNLVLEGGQETLDGLVAGVDRGLLVTRVWYTNIVDPGTVTLTGMTRDGLFAIEKGKLTHAVRNFRFNQSVVELLGGIEAMTAPERVAGVVCPAVRARGFHMSSVTEF
jgi:PmbA protein